MSFLQLLMADDGSMATLTEEKITVGNFHATQEFSFLLFDGEYCCRGLSLISERQFMHKIITVRLFFLGLL